MKRVLMVEDTPEFQEALAGLLDQMNQSWQVFSFINGQSTLEFVRQSTTPMDLVLVDLGLPDISGCELIREIHEIWPNVPIVVISVFTDSEKVLNAIRAGAIGYLVKSNPDAIAQGIQKVLAGEFPISPLVARHLRLSSSIHRQPQAKPPKSTPKTTNVAYTPPK